MSECLDIMSIPPSASIVSWENRRHNNITIFLTWKNNNVEIKSNKLYLWFCLVHKYNVLFTMRQLSE